MRLRRLGTCQATRERGRPMDLGKVIRELDVEPDEELVPAPNEAPRTVPEHIPAGPAAVPQ